MTATCSNVNRSSVNMMETSGLAAMEFRHGVQGEFRRDEREGPCCAAGSEPWRTGCQDRESKVNAIRFADSGRSKWVFVLWLLVLTMLVPAPAVALVLVPPLQARLTDLTGTLTGEQQAGLEDRKSTRLNSSHRH